jgi:tetratricopeptide (TPR) repeat protein
MRLLALAFLPHCHYLELQGKVAMMLEESAMNERTEDARFSRRDALCRLALLPLLTLKLTPLQAVVKHPTEDILTQCAASIAACWELSKSSEGADLRLAFQGVSAFIPTLKAIVKESPRYQQEAAALVTQCCLLQTVLGWHLEGLTRAAIYARDAIRYAKQAEDIPLLLSALNKMTWLHYYSNRSKQAQTTIEQALPFLKTSKTPLPSLRVAGTYSTMAVMQARNGQKASASLRQATEAFFGQQRDDLNYVYIDFTEGNLILNDGLAHYQQGDYEQAIDSLSQLIDPETLAMKKALPERTSVEGLTMMTLASLKSEQRDQERIVFFWQAAIEGARTLQSEQRFQEALLAYELMQTLWPGEKRVAALRDLTIHW